MLGKNTILKQSLLPSKGGYEGSKFASGGRKARLAGASRGGAVHAYRHKDHQEERLLDSERAAACRHRRAHRYSQRRGSLRLRLSARHHPRTGSPVHL